MIEIKISGNTPLEALASLTAFGLRCMGNEEVCAAANRILEAEQTKEHKEATKVSKVDTATLATSAVAADTELSDAAGKATTPAKSDSVADLPSEPYVEDPPHEDPEPAPKPEPKLGDQPKPPTLAEVRAKGVEAAKKYGQATVKAILDGFGVPSMTALPEGDRTAFLVKLEELEGQGDGNA